MKVRDFIEAERFFHKEPKEKKEMSIKEYLRFKKALRMVEEEEKKERKEDKPKTWWDKQSVVQKTAYLFLGGHLLTLFYISIIMKAAAQMSGAR